MFGIKVVDASGKRISLIKAFIRNIVKFSSFGFLCAVCLFTKNKQNIHDFAAKTFVVYADTAKPASSSDESTKPVVITILILMIPILIFAAVNYKRLGINSLKDLDLINLETLVQKQEDLTSSMEMDNSEQYMQDIGISMSLPDTPKRNFSYENAIKENSYMSEFIRYYVFSSLCTIYIEKAVYSIDVTAEDIMQKAIYETVYSSKYPYEIDYIEISGMKAAKAVINITFEEHKSIYEIIVIADTKNTAWIIKGSTDKEKYYPLLRKYMDSIKIESRGKNK